MEIKIVVKKDTNRVFGAGDPASMERLAGAFKSRGDLDVYLVEDLKYNATTILSTNFHAIGVECYAAKNGKLYYMLLENPMMMTDEEIESLMSLR